MLFGILTVVFIVISVVMVLIILVQRPQGGGLAGAFGGAGGGGADTVFGGRVGDALTWATSIIFVVFLVLAIGLNLLDDSSVRQRAAAADSVQGIQSAPENRPETPADGGGTSGESPAGPQDGGGTPE